MPKQETANIEKIQSVYEEIVKRIKDGPKTALSYFNAEWSNFSYLEKEILRIFIERFHEAVLKEDKLPLVNQIILSEIYINSDIDLQADISNGIIMLDQRVKDIQIAKLFHELKKKGLILNTIEDLSGALSKIFNLKAKTIISYLSNPDKMNKTISLI